MPFLYIQAHWDSKHSKMGPLPPEYAEQFAANVAAKKAAQRQKGTSANGKGQKADKKKGKKK